MDRERSSPLPLRENQPPNQPSSPPLDFELEQGVLVGAGVGAGAFGVTETIAGFVILRVGWPEMTIVCAGADGQANVRVFVP